jgi:hypothetical protein
MSMTDWCRLSTSMGVAILLFAPLASQTHAHAQAADDDNAYLNQLQGAWDMPGTFGGKPVHYHASGERVLQGGFLRLHMVDTEPKPQYEADVFIGFDAQRHDFIAHWLDRFGAAGARVFATGKRNGPRLVMTFPYTSGAFRDTFTFISETGAWTLLLESQDSTGTWSTFATYTLTRPK